VVSQYLRDNKDFVSSQHQTRELSNINPRIDDSWFRSLCLSTTRCVCWKTCKADVSRLVIRLIVVLHIRFDLQVYSPLKKVSAHVLHVESSRFLLKSKDLVGENEFKTCNALGISKRRTRASFRPKRELLA